MLNWKQQRLFLLALQSHRVFYELLNFLFASEQVNSWPNFLAEFFPL